MILIATDVLAQTQNRTAAASEPGDQQEWSFSFATYGYIVPHDQSYVSPVFTTDHQWFHAEARFNYEDQNTGSLWLGYNLSAGRHLTLEVTPMLGVVMGNTTGVAPGYKFALTYKQVTLSSEGEFVFDARNHHDSFFYSWNELTYSPVEWFYTGLVAQRTRAYHTELDVQRGFLVGVSYKRAALTTYIFNAGWTDPTIVVALSFRF